MRRTWAFRDLVQSPPWHTHTWFSPRARRARALARVGDAAHAPRAMSDCAWQGAHVFAAADADGDGKVSFAEFVALFGKAAENAAQNKADKPSGQAAPSRKRKKP